MQKPFPTISILVTALLLTGCAGNAIAQANEVSPPVLPEMQEPTAIPTAILIKTAGDCPVTVPGKASFKPPASELLKSSQPDLFWFGTDHLWTSLPMDGIWAELPKSEDGYTQKVFWWSDLFSLKDELEPELVVTGERLDDQNLPLTASKATNAYDSDIGTAMLVGVDFPTAGCWKITGQYKKAELSFVVWVAP